MIAELALVPASGGRFEVSVDGELLFTKLGLGRHAEPGEVVALAQELMGPPVGDDEGRRRWVSPGR